MNTNPFQITHLEPLPDYRLRLTYADGETLEVDLREWIDTTPALAPLKNKDLFPRAKPGLGGHWVEWSDIELDLGSDNLRNLAIEQAGGIGHERLWNWLHEAGLTEQEAAEALGVPPDTLRRYLDGIEPVPRYIWLACLGWNVVRVEGTTERKDVPTAQKASP